MVITNKDKELLDPRETDLRKGAMFPIYKPISWTSFDVVKKLRGVLNKSYMQKRFKVGHAGTLDPLAEGLLIICIGKATKTISEYMHLPKVYYGEIVFGATTPSYDKETEIDKHFDTEELNLEKIRNAASGFVGKIKQVPPMYSAIKVKGRRLYKLARKGKMVQRRARAVVVYSFDIHNFQNDVSEFSVKCSKGTYIRSLASDLGKELDNGAHLSKLERVSIGDFHIDQAWKIKDLVSILSSKYVLK